MYQNQAQVKNCDAIAVVDILSCIWLGGESMMNERLHDMTPKGKLLDVIIASPKTIQEINRCNKHLVLIRWHKL